MDTEALRKSLLSKFRDVTADRLEKIGLALLALEKDPKAEGPADDVARELHTMKGEARMLGLPRIGELAHAAEDLLKAARDGRATLGTATDLLLQAGDLVSTLCDDLPAAEQPNEPTSTLVTALLTAAGKTPGASPAAVPAPAPAPAPSRFAPAAAPAAKAGVAEPAKPGADKPKPADAKPPEEKPVSDGGARDAGRSIRVAVDALDLLGALAGDLLVEGARANLRAGELAGLIQRVNRMGDRFLAFVDRVAGKVPAEIAALTRLESDLHLLRDDTFRFVRQNADGTNALNGYLERLAEQVAEARLVPLSTVFAAFPRAVRDVARQQGKEVELNVDNAEVGVDRGVLGEVRDAMVHLLRNSVDHGIESPEAREKDGKPRAGRIAVRVRADGGMLALDVEDDGRGIDAQRLREVSVARRVLTAPQAAALSDREAIDLIFLPGFSTRDEVTELSGRGVGMAVVKKKVEALGGSVAVTSVPGKWTRMSLRLPQSLALMRVLLVRLGADAFGIPAVDVQAVGRVRPQEKTVVAGRDAVEFRGRPVALVELAALLKLKSGPVPEAPLCVFVQHGEDRAAFVVDGFVGEREVAVKPCGGDFLKGAPFLAGAAALEDGSVAVLLHVPDVLAEIRRSGGQGAVARVQDRKLRVLLVEDSPIARATETALVRALGHAVDEAVDGQDGLERIAGQAYDLVLCDVQMPRMDGIELTRRLKADPATTKIPVVILTSLASPEDRRRGLDAGADAYLVKGELSSETLAQTFARLS
ncbi:MAG TPA: response regulator [Myxococcales bacterium]